MEQAEACLRELGIDGDLRVRHRGDHASVEVIATMHSAVESHWGHITARFAALGIPQVELDPRGYRRGGLLSELPVLGD